MGFVGRFSPEKNLEMLLEAFAETSKYVFDTKLILVGGGPIETSLRKLVHDKGIEDRVVFTGAKHDVSARGRPTSLLEAMSSCKAIVASNIPCIREIVKNDKEAILVNPNDIEELEQAILLLFNNEELRTRLGHNAAKRVRSYDVNVVYSRIVRTYEKLARAGCLSIGGVSQR